MAEKRATRIVIADDHPVLREGLRALLKGQPDLDVVGEAADGVEAMRLVQEKAPDVLLLDLAMPRLSGMEVLRQVARGTTKIIIFAAEVSREATMSALRLGARGVLLKDSDPNVLFKCIHCVARGEHWVGREVVADVVKALAEMETGQRRSVEPYGLTAREREVLALVAAGFANRQIAEKFNVSTDTVKHHLTNIFDKTGMSTRLELAVFANSHHLV